jgi:hypothetical protein
VELRTEIDRARRGQGAGAGRIALERAIALAQAHPEAMRTKFIRHNVGAARLAWLAAHAAGVSQVDTTQPLVGGVSGTENEP